MYLNSSALMNPLHGIKHFDVDLGSIECTITRVNPPISFAYRSIKMATKYEAIMQVKMVMLVLSKVMVEMVIKSKVTSCW